MNRLYWMGTPHDIILHDPMNAEYLIGALHQKEDGKIGFIFCQDPMLIFMVAQNHMATPSCIDNTLKEWAGQHLLHFINTAEIHLRDYSRIGQRF